MDTRDITFILHVELIVRELLEAALSGHERAQWLLAIVDAGRYFSVDPGSI